MSSEKNNAYDICVIGCGPGGFAAAMRAFDLGQKVCIVEGGEIGGAGVMWGALASKTMWELAKDYAITARVDRGYRASGLTVDYRAVRQTVFQAVREKQYQMLSQIETFSPQRWQGPGSLTLKRGRGAFLSPHTLAVRYPDGRHEEISAASIIIATGSRPRKFPGVPVDRERIFDSDSILKLKTFPQRLIIVGAGIIGCEYASIFSNYAQTKVYLIDHADRILPFEDDDVSEFVSANLKKRGVEIFHSAILRSIDSRTDLLEAVLDFEDGHSQVLNVDAALIAIGRQPNLSALNLEVAGIQPDERGFLVTDAHCRVRGDIYAAGDVTAHPALVNIAETEGRYAAKAICRANRHPLNYGNMSTVMFFYPAVAAVGKNEKMCRKKKMPYRVAYYSNSLLSRAIAMRAMSGFVKIIVSDDDQNRILGMRAAGPQVSNTIMSIAMLMDQGMGIRHVLKTVHPHPTMSEGIQECLRLLLNKSIYKDHAFPGIINMRRWHPA